MTKTDRLRELLIKWGRSNRADYEWRYVDDPYKVLLSEFMLHRTAAAQARPVFNEMAQRFPSLESFVRGDPDEIRETLRPLGLNWRIEGMIDAMHAIHEKYGRVPHSREDLHLIQGIGPYIAGATVCFSRDHKETLVDTNTVRVIGRVFGLDLSGEARRRKEVIETIGEAADPRNPRDFYYSLIDLAHSVCLPRNPLCDECPLLPVPCEYGSERTSD